MLFRGTYEHQLDDKNRLRIPAKFKKGAAQRRKQLDLPLFRKKFLTILFSTDTSAAPPMWISRERSCLTIL